MKFTLSELKRFLITTGNIDAGNIDSDNIDKIAEALIMLGHEVESVHDRKLEMHDFEVGEILTAIPHPNADKLKLCQVRVREGILDIVCGAPNARTGIKVVVAKVGTVIPQGGIKIKESQIRGVISYGMLCSATELGIKADNNSQNNNFQGNNSEGNNSRGNKDEKNEDTGIIELPADAIVGDNITSWLGLDDPVIDVTVTPNRGDVLSVYGIARELAAIRIGELKQLNYPLIKEEFSPDLMLECKVKEACYFFAVRQINIQNNCQSPIWLQKLLKNIGIKPVSAVVDITNYIAHSFGQPLHAYDMEQINGNLVIETLNESVSFLSLNDRSYELQQGDLIIRDDKNICCLAGIIGSKASACLPETKIILLEAASFNPEYITRAGRRLMIDTDSRYRFERYVNPEFTIRALDMATDLIMSICSARDGGKGDGKDVSEGASNGDSKASRVIYTGNAMLDKRVIEFEIDFLEKKSGLCLSKEKIIQILTDLGFSCKMNQDIIVIVVPAWRRDVLIKEDIVEEILRIYGYDNIPMTPLPVINSNGQITPKEQSTREQRRISHLKRLLAVNGYTEVVTWSFMDSKKAACFTDDMQEELFLQNPISSDLDYMRPSILPNLLKIAGNNINRSFKDLSIFEIGPIFAKNATATEAVTAIRTGYNAVRNNFNSARPFDIFDVKSDIGDILEYSRLAIEKCHINNNAPGYYHPARSARLMLGKNTIAYFGQIHPLVLKNFAIEAEIIGFELFLSALPYPKKKYGEEYAKKGVVNFSDYQAINRDYAFIMDARQPVGEIISFIKNINMDLIKEVNLFDIYTGNKIAAGKKSVALSVRIQDNNGTLTEHNINNLDHCIILGVQEKFAAKLRDY